MLAIDEIDFAGDCITASSWTGPAFGLLDAAERDALECFFGLRPPQVDDGTVLSLIEPVQIPCPDPCSSIIPEPTPLAADGGASPSLNGRGFALRAEPLPLPAALPPCTREGANGSKFSLQFQLEFSSEGGASRRLAKGVVEVPSARRGCLLMEEELERGAGAWLSEKTVKSAPLAMVAEVRE